MQTAAFQRLKEILKIEEGFRQFPYEDTQKKLTIGYGFNLTDVGLSREESDYILNLRMAKVEDQLCREYQPYLQLDLVRQCVLIDMAYNLGMAGLLQFHDLITALNVKNYAAAAQAMRNSLWYKEVGHRGEYLASLMENGKWQ